jgi:hypothetical protein
LGRIENRVSHPHRAYCGFRDIVGIHGAGISAARRQPGHSREKGVKLRLRDLVLIDMRLALEHDFGAADVAGEIHARDHIEWNAGKAGRIDDVQGGEYIAGDLAVAIDGDGRRLALLRSKLFGPGPDDSHDLGCQTVQEVPGFGICLRSA